MNPQRGFISASSHLWNGLVPDLPAAPETLTSRSLLPRDAHGDGWNKWKEVEAETGPCGLLWLQQETGSINCKSTQKILRLS